MGGADDDFDLDGAKDGGKSEIKFNNTYVFITDEGVVLDIQHHGMFLISLVELMQMMMKWMKTRQKMLLEKLPHPPMILRRNHEVFKHPSFFSLV